MSKSLQHILGGKNLSGVIQGIKPGLAGDIMPPGFLRATRGVIGDKATYFRVEGVRKTARQVHYGSPSVNRKQSGITEVPVKLAHTFEHIHHKPSVLQNLLNPNDGSIQQMGEQEISRQTADFQQLFMNLRVATVQQALFTGNIFFDNEGDLLASSSGAVITIDMQIPAANKNQLNILGGGNLISADWDTDGTDIIGDMSNIHTAARKKTGYPIQTAFYGADVPSILLGNTALKEILNRNPRTQEAFMNGMVSNNTLGVANWVPASDAFFEDADGTLQSIIGDKNVVFTPNPSPEWWEVIEGTYPVPTNIGNISADGSGALTNVTNTRGMFSYAHVLSDPVTIKHLAGDTFLPLIKVPNAVFIATVSGF